MHPTRCDRTKAALNASQIQRIAATAPGLEHVALNVHRSGHNGVWPLEVFEAVAAMPRLVSADVWLDVYIGYLPPYEGEENRPRAGARHLLGGRLDPALGWADLRAELA